jgi:PAS domain S-box-containing protein
MTSTANGHTEVPIQPILDTAIDGIVIIDGDGIVQLFNRAAEKMFGYTAIEIIGRNVKVLMPPPFSSEHDAYLRNYLTRGVKRIIGIGREVVAQRRDGTTFPVELAVGEVHDHPRLRFVGFIRDVSEKKQLERRSLRAQRLESIGTLVGGIAHDLNNVLTPIVMAIRLLQKPQSAESRDELLATAQASADRGVALIKQLLTFAGGPDASKTVIQIADTIQEVRLLLEHTIPKSIHIEIKVPEGLWSILGDATQLAQIVMNLCVNARDAMPQGGMLTVTAANVTVSHPLPCLPANLPSRTREPGYTLMSWTRFSTPFSRRKSLAAARGWD